VLPGDAKVLPNKGAGSDSAQKDKDLRVYQVDLPLEPAHAGGLLVWERIPISWGTAFDDVRDIHLRSIQADDLQHGVQQLPGRAHEGLTLQILLLAGALTDEHDRGLFIAYPKHQIFACQAQITALALAALLF
jgi:hypothetical protein